VNGPADDPRPDDATDHALRSALRDEGLSSAALNRIRRATEAEWRNNVVASPRRGRMPLAAAASVALVLAGALGVYLQLGQGPAGALVGSVGRFDAPGLGLEQWPRRDAPLVAGSEVRVSNELRARGDSSIALTRGGTLRLARGTEIAVPDSTTIRLLRGEVYVDLPPGAHQTELRVVTPEGEFRHVGTQFAVALLGGQTRLRVREGSVRWNAGGEHQVLAAGSEATIANGQWSTRSISTAGREWSWVEALAPEIEIEGRPLTLFLEWFARETGRKLELADDATRTRVAGIRMHGDVRGLAALEALSAVMSATSLRYELREGAIRVSSAGEEAPAI
jgi:ferric-dicitrate binding protein FerR (iron transport regulator)